MEMKATLVVAPFDAQISEAWFNRLPHKFGFSCDRIDSDGDNNGHNDSPKFGFQTPPRETKILC